MIKLVIYIDSRGSGEKELFTLLNNKHLAVEQKYLESADICFGEVGIERKEVNDLVNSVIGENRHYWQQLKVLKDTYKKPIVIIEGTVNWKDKMVAGIILSTLLKWNIPIIQTHNIYDTAEKIYQMFTCYGSNKCKSYPPIVVKKGLTVKEIQWCMLMTVRGIGTETAKKILKYVEFKCIGECDPKQLSKNIKGLGLKTATKLVEVFR